MRQIEDNSEVNYLINALSPEQKEAVILRFGEQLEFREIAKIMGCNMRTAQSRVRNAGLLFTIELFAILIVGNLVSQIFFLGTAGWDMPVQLIKLISIAPMNMLQAELYEYTFTFLGAIGFAGVVMFISAKIRSNVLALLFSLAVVYGPMMIAEYLPYGVQKALDLIPLAGSAADIFRTNTFHIFGKYIWSPYLLISVPVLIGILCIPLAVKGWSRRLRI